MSTSSQNIAIFVLEDFWIKTTAETWLSESKFTIVNAFAAPPHSSPVNEEDASRHLAEPMFIRPFVNLVNEVV